jgi:hypothetical protein
VLDSKGSVGLLEGRKEKIDLDHGGPVTVVAERDEHAVIRGKKDMHLLPRFCRPGPKTSPKTFPEVEVELMFNLLVTVVLGSAFVIRET